MNRISEWLIQKIYPNLCPVCQTKQKHPTFCQACAANLPWPSKKHCAVCGFLKTTHDETCGACLSQSYPFKDQFFLFLYEDPIKSLIHQFKFFGKLELARPFAFLINQKLKAQIASFDWIVPIPSSIKKLKERGFDPLLELAIKMDGSGKKLLPQALKKVRHTPSQVGLSKENRLRNLDSAFELENKVKPQIKGKKILLIDDVITTGTTLSQATMVLQKAKPAFVSILTLAANPIR